MAGRIGNAKNNPAQNARITDVSINGRGWLRANDTG